MVDSPAYPHILTDGQAVVIKGKRTTPVFLVGRLVAIQPVRVLQYQTTPLSPASCRGDPVWSPAVLAL
ncbi:MAG TPA: hypothetical protein PLD47_14710 [Aggregatilineales bacterium]|nr:hypothetical protein [Anaerolineales bacterium]HRE48976.1 hypothetical protein [Aggregatilineales bacterium]